LITGDRMQRMTPTLAPTVDGCSLEVLRTL